MAGAEDVLAEVAVGVGRVDGSAQGGDGVGVLGPDVDVALVGAHGVGRDGHALDQGERVALDHHPVGERAGVALVEVAGDELLVGDGLEDGLPLDACREARSSTTAQARVGDLLDHLGRSERQGAAQAGPAAVRLVVVDRRRVDDPHPDEAHALLRGEPGVLVDDTDGTCRAPPPAPRRRLWARRWRSRRDRPRSRPPPAARARASRASRCVRRPRRRPRTRRRPRRPRPRRRRRRRGRRPSSGRSSPALRQRVEALARQPAVQASVEHPGRTERAVAEAEDLVDLHVGARARRRGRASRRTAPRPRPTGRPRRDTARPCGRRAGSVRKSL